MRRVAVFDTETTGIDVEADHIVSAFFGILDENGELELAKDYLIRPEGWEIPEAATEVHGITTEFALEHGTPAAVVLNQIYGDLIDCLTDRVPLAGHNIVYDLTIFDREYQQLEPNLRGVEWFLKDGLIVLDSLVIDKKIDRYRKGKRVLITTAEVYGVELSEDEAHGARADAIASGRIIQKQLEDFDIKPYGPKQLMALQAQWKKEQAASLQNYFRYTAPEPDPEAVVNGDWPLIPRGGRNGQPTE